ncbi:hypothetical protein ACYCFL_05585 [Stutzerimonas nitrititolerans]|uniref:hypothetical protein n=1 Tax=Stutzerimonas nitrititolerans TaxID=2482751 RepID=UPI0028A277B0|nr:hypothetical protein [Stutzerimonas nitrititolerans]
MLQYSEGIRNALMTVGPLRQLLTGCQIRIYSGAVPPSPVDAVGTAVKLCTITLDGGATGLGFEDSATNGTLTKASAETWQGNVLVSGRASFFRIVAPEDSDGVSAVSYRIQGRVDVAGSDMNLSNPELTAGGVQTIDHFYLTMPEV